MTHQVGVFVRVDDGFVECLTEAGAVRVVEGVQVYEFAGACGQFGEGLGAFEFPGGGLGDRESARPTGLSQSMRAPMEQESPPSGVQPGTS